MSGHLLLPGSVYAFLAEHRRELSTDVSFADLFPSPRGRPSEPADLVGAAFVLRAPEGRSDREAAEALTLGLRWKAAPRAAGRRGRVPSHAGVLPRTGTDAQVSGAAGILGDAHRSLHRLPADDPTATDA